MCVFDFNSLISEPLQTDLPYIERNCQLKKYIYRKLCVRMTGAFYTMKFML